MSGNPVGLVEFLTRRLDDEQAAWSGGLDLATRPEFAKLAQHQLADIAAKRRIIDEIEKTLLRLEWTGMYSVREEGRLLLKLLAAPFSSHPDWQPEWSVE